MAIKAIFVGINKHLDAAIPELSGARRDATALWALFTDTVEGLSARLLVDEAATHAEVSSALLGTLTGATADDVVTLPLSDVVHSHSVTRLSLAGPRASLLRTSWG